MTTKRGVKGTISKVCICSIVLASILTISMLVCGPPAPAASELSSVAKTANEIQGSVIEDFLNPRHTEKLMARLWFADGSAGMDDNDVVEKTILALADEGFGGVEVQYLADGSDYTNQQAESYGWGSESWQLLLKKIFAAANRVEGGFRVDLTCTSHWPPEINIIDPNDDAAATEISSTLTKIKTSDIGNGFVELNLPVTKTADGGGANFIFTDSFISANAVQVLSVENGVVTLDYNTLTGAVPTSAVTCEDAAGIDGDTCRQIDGVYYKGSPAGVPSREYAGEMGWDYTETLNAFGPEPAEDADFSASYNGKMDRNFNRARLADWQYVQSADLSGLPVEAANDDDGIQAGDWVIIATYYRGTGQVKSGGSTVTMYNRTYVPNYYDASGVEVISEYWWNYIIDDQLEALLRENGGSIFEDSIETSSASKNWAYDILNEIPDILGENYAYVNIMAAIVGATARTEAYRYVFDTSDNETADLIERLEEDFSYVLNQLYLEEHIQAFNEFANSFGYTYRAQIGDANQYDANAALLIDVAETDAANRSAITAVLFNDTNGLLSKEAMAGFTAFNYSLEDILIEFNSNFSWGYNRLIIHGCSYPKLLNGGKDKDGDWPGYPPFGSSFGEPYGYRMPYWDSFDIMADQVAGIQAVLQTGQLKLDLLVMGDWPYANVLTDYGYSYSTSGQDTTYRNNAESVLFDENAVITEGVLDKDGPGYKAIIVSQIDCFSAKGMAKLHEFASKGLPIVFYDCNPSDVEGTYGETNSPEAMIETYKSILADFPENTAVLDKNDTLIDVAAALVSMGAAPNASYEAENLEVALYEDEGDGSLYYYLFNNTTENNFMPSSDIGTSYKTTDILDKWVTLSGEGDVYFLDPLNRSVTQAPEYVDNGDGTICVHIDKLAAGASTFAVITRDTMNFPEAAEYIESVSFEEASRGGRMPFMMAFGAGTGPEPSLEHSLRRDSDGNIYLQAYKAGTYRMAFSDGTEKNITVGEVSNDIPLESWDLTIGSWGPVHRNAADLYDPETGIQTVDPAESKFTDIDFGEQALGSWSEIPATDAQLEQIGVSGMNAVCGRGYYNTTFDWTDKNAGAILSYTYQQGQITGITVNGTTLDKVDNIDDQMDITEYLIAGENRLTIEYTSTLANRVRVENRSLSRLPAVDYGLTGAKLSVYEAVDLSGE